MAFHGIIRAKTISDNVWVTGYYVFCGGKHYVKKGESFSEGWHEIDEATINRYCEINDVSNQMIFEGDILEQKHHDYFKNLILVDNYVVCHPPKRFGFVLQIASCYENPKSKDGYKLPRDANKMKVIGNVIDNPDLLQKIIELGRVRE